MTSRPSGSPGKSENTDDSHDRAATFAAKEKQAKVTAAVWDSRVKVISVASFALGCLWIFMFPLVTVTTGEAKPRGTFFDENAMLIHHTSTKLTAADVDWARPGPLNEAYPRDGLGGASWVCSVLSGMDLPCYTHTFYDRSAARSRLRTSVYTVLEPAPGSDGKECLVLTTAQDLSGSAEQMLDRPDFAGLSLSLSVLKQLKDHVGWMSKRLIVLVADEDLEEPREERLHLGVKNFIDDYHLNTLDLLDRHAKDSNMTTSIQHGGVIRAALSLESPEPGEPEVVQLLTSGINGELPNMDLLNAAVFHHERQGLGVFLDTCSSPQGDGPFACPDAAGRAARACRRRFPHSAKGDAAQRYLDRLFYMLGFMGSATMGPSGPHAHLLRHSVDALTIRSRVGATRRDAVGKGQRTTSGSGVRSTAAVLSIVRGVSNLEEELHHSFFSYLMLSTSSFVSIGEYAYALVLLLVPLALQGRRLVTLNEDRQLLGAVLVVGVFQVFGALLLWLASAWPEPSAEKLSVYLQVIDLAGYALVLLLRLIGPPKAVKRKRHTFWEGPKMVMSCLVGYSCTVTALLSWQVAAVIALTHVPLLTMVRPFQRKAVASWCMVPAMAISSPAQWSAVLGWVTARASGTGVMLQWLRWFRLSGLLNVPLMCFVSMPVHLTVAFVLFAP